MSDRPCKVYYRAADNRVVEADLTTIRPYSNGRTPVLVSAGSAFHPAAVLRLGWIFFAQDNTPDAVSRLIKARYSVIPTKATAESRGETSQDRNGGKKATTGAGA